MLKICSSRLCCYPEVHSTSRLVLDENECWPSQMLAIDRGQACRLDWGRYLAVLIFAVHFCSPTQPNPGRPIQPLTPADELARHTVVISPPILQHNIEHYISSCRAVSPDTQHRGMEQAPWNIAPQRILDHNKCKAIMLWNGWKQKTISKTWNQHLNLGLNISTNIYFIISGVMISTHIGNYGKPTECRGSDTLDKVRNAFGKQFAESSSQERPHDKWFHGKRVLCCEPYLELMANPCVGAAVTTRFL
jgi:hypothetical protein